MSISLALTALAALAPAQEVAWEYELGNAMLPRRTIQAATTPDGGVLTTVIVETGSGPEILTARYDANGDRLWSDTVTGLDLTSTASSYSLEIAPPSVVALPSGDSVEAVPSFPHSVVTLRDPAGVPRWTRTLSSSNYAFSVSHLLAGPDGTVYAVAGESVNLYPDVLVYALDPANGQTVWSQRAHRFVAKRLTFVGSDRVVIGGTSDFPTLTNFPFQVVFDSVSGAILSAGSAGGTATFDGLAPKSNGFVNLTDQRFIQSYDQNGAYDNSASYLLVVGSTAIEGTAIATGVADEIHASGTAKPSGGPDRAILVTYDSSTGAVRDVSPSGASTGGDTRGLGVVADAFGAVLAWDEASVPNSLRLTRFLPDGTEAWTTALVSFDVAADADRLLLGERGNVLAAATGELGGPANPARTLRLSKVTDGGAVGSTYCGSAVPNSTGAPATIEALGSDGALRDNLTLRSSSLPVGSLMLFLASRTQGFVPAVGGGQGTLCLGGSIGRYIGPGEPRRASGTGTVSLQLALDGVPQPAGFVTATVGDTWNFQGWYRDVNPQITSNLTNAVAVTLQ